MKVIQSENVMKCLQNLWGWKKAAGTRKPSDFHFNILAGELNKVFLLNYRNYSNFVGNCSHQSSSQIYSDHHKLNKLKLTINQSIHVIFLVMLLDICQICRSARNVCNVVIYSNVIKDALARVKQAAMAEHKSNKYRTHYTS